MTKRKHLQDTTSSPAENTHTEFSIQGLNFEITYSNDKFDLKKGEYREMFEKLVDDDWDVETLLTTKQYRIIVETRDNKTCKISTTTKRELNEDEIRALFLAAKRVHAKRMIIAENAPYQQLRSEIDKQSQFSTVNSLSRDFNISVMDQFILSLNSFYSYEQARLPRPTLANI